MSDITIKKVHIESLMSILSDLFEKGVDFVDIYGSKGDVADVVGLSFSKEYMSKEFQSNFDDMSFSSSKEEESPDVSNFKIDINNDDDLNQLL